MYSKIFASLFMMFIMIAGCSQQADDGTSEQEVPGAGEQQGMPGQMVQPADIDDVTDEEIDNLVDAVGEIQVINMGAQQKMAETIEDEGMSQQRFQELQMSQQQGEGEMDATDAEMEQFLNIMEAMQNVQAGLHEEMEEAVEDAGLSVERYEQIVTAAQQDEALMQKIENRIEESMEQPQ